jgi:hypothetical protein
MIVTLEGILSLFFLPLSSRVPSTQKTGWHLYEYRLPKSHKGDSIYEEACSGMVSGDGLDACRVWLEWFQGKH